MPDVEWIMENCHMMRDNGCWAGEKQISYASPDGQYTYYVNKHRDGTGTITLVFDGKII